MTSAMVSDVLETKALSAGDELNDPDLVSPRQDSPEPGDSEGDGDDPEGPALDDEITIEGTELVDQLVFYSELI